MDKLKNPALIIGLLVLVGLAVLFIYTYQQDERPSANQQKNYECRDFDGEEHCTDIYLGLSEEYAIEKALNNRFTAKIKERDGDTNITNTDLGGRPVFFTVENGVIIKAEFN